MYLIQVTPHEDSDNWQVEVIHTEGFELEGEGDERFIAEGDGVGGTFVAKSLGQFGPALQNIVQHVEEDYASRQAQQESEGAEAGAPEEQKEDPEEGVGDGEEDE